MNVRRTVPLVAAVLCASWTALGAPNTLPIYIEDNHAGTFYWLAQHVELDEPCTLVHFDAHSDASGIFDSDKIRDAMRNVASLQDRQSLCERWRNKGVVQCFNWIEPLMPAPIVKVIWVPGEKIAGQMIEQWSREAGALLDGHLEAAPRRSGSFRDRYVVSDLEKLDTLLDDRTPIIITIDLDYFGKIPAAEQETAFRHVWNFAVKQRNLRALTFAISSPYQDNNAAADRLLELALRAALSLPTARIEFEPFLSVVNDRSARAKELQAAGRPLPAYDISIAPEELHARILAERGRIIVQHDRTRWENLLVSWENEAARLHLEVKGAQPSTDGVWRVPAGEQTEIELIAQPWMAKPEKIEWFALTPKYSNCNVTELRAGQVGFVKNAAARPEWNEIPIAYHDANLPIAKIDNYFDRRQHCGSLRLRARAVIDGKIRETPPLELRRCAGTGFRAGISEQFGLPYLFGSGELQDGSNTGPETGLGSDCANLVVYALRRQGLRVPWTDPKGLRDYLDLAASSVSPGTARFTPEELERGLIVHLGTHVAAVMEDRPPLGVLDGNDVVAHQLGKTPETLTLAELFRTRRKDAFHLFRVPTGEASQALIFGGDVMLGRTCAVKIKQGFDPFAGVADFLAHSCFAAANLECTISGLGKPGDRAAYSFRAPPESARLLRKAGFRAVGLANNHALDFGADALNESATELSRANVETAGAGDEPYSPKLFSLSGGKKLALLAISDVTRGPSWGKAVARADNRVLLEAAIAKARSQADIVACLVHWGIENTSIVTDEQRELARWLVDNGVDLVVGSHPHCVQSLDFYHGCPVAYSLGNLVFDGAPTVASWNHGALLEVRLSAGAKITATRLVPIVLEDGLPKIVMSPEKDSFASQ